MVSLTKARILVAALVIASLCACGPFGSSAPRLKSGNPVRTLPMGRSTATPPTRVLQKYPMSRTYVAFIRLVCQSFAGKSGASIVNLLPHYRYNSSDPYFGAFNRGEGQWAVPSVVRGWVKSGRIRCIRYTASIDGHGDIVTRGWALTGSWGLIDVDEFSGKWKINDLTVGTSSAVRHAFFGTAPWSVAYTNKP